MNKLMCIIMLFLLTGINYAQKDISKNDEIVQIIDSLSRDYGKINRLLYVNVETQKMFFIEKNEIKKMYPISTGAAGSEYGAVKGSLKTPLGVLRIVDKIGDNAPVGEIFKWKRDMGKKATIYTEKGSYPKNIRDDVLTRVIILDGQEKGINKGKNKAGKSVDAFQRGIYIHGTNNEADIGTPASHGCVRMINTDIVELYEFVKKGDYVFIK